MNEKLRRELDEAERKAIDALGRYKFQMFGYWAAIWVHLNRISGLKRPNPFRHLVVAARTKSEGITMRSKLGWSKEDHDKEDAMNSPEVRAGFYEVIDLATDEQHGSYATLDEARAAVRYDRLKAYAIWRDNVRVECCDPYDGDDDRMKQAMGEPNESEREDDGCPLDPMAQHLA